MKAIGGFFEFLLPQQSFSYHENALALTNARACIRATIQNSKMTKCYLPNYNCDVVFHPFQLEDITYEMYHIDESMTPTSLPKLGENEYFYYINYYGVKSDVVKELYEHYGDRLIIDNTHDFFRKGQYNCWSFTSARKYFGVPDGAFLYSPKEITLHDYPERFSDYSTIHSIERLKGNQAFAFKAYQEYEKSLNSEIKRISVVSEKLLSQVSIDTVISRRRQNFKTLHNILNSYNNFKFAPLGEADVPFAYPFLPSAHFDKSLLYKDQIFVPTLWKDALARTETTEFEQELAVNLMPLPIDERYTDEDMEFMAMRILNIIKNV